MFGDNWFNRILGYLSSLHQVIKMSTLELIDKRDWLLLW